MSKRGKNEVAEQFARGREGALKDYAYKEITQGGETVRYVKYQQQHEARGVSATERSAGKSMSLKEQAAQNRQHTAQTAREAREATQRTFDEITRESASRTGSATDEATSAPGWFRQPRERFRQTRYDLAMLPYREAINGFAERVRSAPELTRADLVRKVADGDYTMDALRGVQDESFHLTGSIIYRSPEFRAANDNKPVVLTEPQIAAAYAATRGTGRLWLFRLTMPKKVRGTVVELGAGQGKTFVEALLANWHSLRSHTPEGAKRPGYGAHVIKSDPKLAKDAHPDLHRVIAKAQGFEVGLLRSREDANYTDVHQRAQYEKPITVGTKSQFYFDRLFDRMVGGSEPLQRGHDAAIVDEADLVMLDSGRTRTSCRSRRRRRPRSAGPTTGRGRPRAPWSVASTSPSAGGPGRSS